MEQIGRWAVGWGKHTIGYLRMHSPDQAAQYPGAQPKKASQLCFRILLNRHVQSSRMSDKDTPLSTKKDIPETSSSAATQAPPVKPGAPLTTLLTEKDIMSSCSWNLKKEVLGWKEKVKVEKWLTHDYTYTHAHHTTHGHSHAHSHTSALA